MSLHRESGCAQAWRQEDRRWAKNGARKGAGERRLTGEGIPQEPLVAFMQGSEGIKSDLAASE